MSCDVEELFRFEKTEGGCSLAEFPKKDDPSITELEIPEEWRGLPVIRIDRYAFSNADKIKSVVFPKSLEELCDEAFCYCFTLERVIFNSEPTFGRNVFACCDSLPADVTLMSLTSSFDLSAPIDKNIFDEAFGEGWCLGDNIFYSYCILRPDVLELAIKHDSFRGVDVSEMVKFSIGRGSVKLLSFLEQSGLLESEALVEELIELAAKRGSTEITAYLLELKNRKFGFKGGSGLEI